MQTGPLIATETSTDQRYRVRTTNGGQTWTAELGFPQEDARTALNEAIAAGRAPEGTMLAGEQFGAMDTAGTIFASEARYWLALSFSGSEPFAYETRESAWEALDAHALAHPIAELTVWLAEHFPTTTDTTPEAIIAAANALGIPVWDYANAVGALATATSNGPGAVMGVVTENSDLLPVWASLAAAAAGRTPKAVPFAALAPMIRALALFGLSGAQLTTMVWAFIDTL